MGMIICISMNICIYIHNENDVTNGKFVSNSVHLLDPSSQQSRDTEGMDVHTISCLRIYTFKNIHIYV
jgi:hypothetical protein